MCFATSASLLCFNLKQVLFCKNDDQPGIFFFIANYACNTPALDANLLRFNHSTEPLKAPFLRESGNPEHAFVSVNRQRCVLKAEISARLSKAHLQTLPLKNQSITESAEALQADAVPATECLRSTSTSQVAPLSINPSTAAAQCPTGCAA